MQAYLASYRSQQSFSLDRDASFSWIRCCISVCSYALLLSDVIRSGVAIRSMDEYKIVEPNSWLSIGPLDFSVAHVQVNESAASSATVWAYKFDTTSVTLRAVAQYYRLASWDQCMFYQGQCMQTTLPSVTVLRMLEGVINAVAARKPFRHGDLPNVVLRTANTYRDRLHEYILIPLFHHPKVRTIQGIYYPSSQVHVSDLQLCNGYQRIRPFACSDNWTNFKRMCSSQDTECTNPHRLLWGHINARLNTLKNDYVGMQLDMLLLEGQEDFGHAHLSFQGRQYFDIAVITRIRNCSIFDSQGNNVCTTVAIDDYRYEAALYTSDVIEWYPVVAFLRIVGQMYAWLHVFMLFLGCYYARLNAVDSKSERLYVTCQASLRAMLTCPSQLVIYGSVFPVGCYAVAHILDCNMMYEIVAQHFVTILGVFHLDIRVFVKMATVSTRSVWILSVAFHAVLYLRTKCCWSSTTKGIPGIPEFLVSAIALLTIGAEFRALVLRNTKLEVISEVLIGSRLRTIRSSRYRNSHGFWYLFFMGDNIDFKCLIASACTITALSVLLWACIRILTMMKLMPRFQFTMWPHTIVSYAADSLWSPNLMMVSWNGFIITRVQNESFGATNRPVVHPSQGPTFNTVTHLRTITSSAFVLSDSARSAQLFKEMVQLETRSREVKATIFLMNLTVMTEPMVFYNLRWCQGRSVSIYRRIRSPRHVFMLPSLIQDSAHNLYFDWDELELLTTMDASELEWTDLLGCG